MKDWLDCAPAFHSGTEMQAYRCLGVKRQGDAYLARIYAPTALRAFLVGEFNAWGESHPMTHPEGDETVFETRISPAEWERGRLYKFKLVTRAGECYVADPFAPRTECAPERASFYDTLDTYPWRDASWLRYRARAAREPLARPCNTYAFSPFGAWCRADGSPAGFSELARELPTYVKAMGFTGVTLLASVGLFAPDPQLGTPHELMQLLDALHEAGVSMTLELPVSEAALRKCGVVPAQPEARSLLLSSLAFWREQYHVDALLIRAGALAACPQGKECLAALSHLWREACADVPLLFQAPSEPLAAMAKEGLAAARAAYLRRMTAPGDKTFWADTAFAPQARKTDQAQPTLDLAAYEHFVATLNHLYLAHPALYRREEIAFETEEGGILSYCRIGERGEVLAVILNLTPHPRDGLRLRLPPAGAWRVLFDTDLAAFGGTGACAPALPVTDAEGLTRLSLPPYGGLVLMGEQRLSPPLI